MQFEFGVALTYMKKYKRPSGSIALKGEYELPVTVLYVRRQHGELVVTEHEHEARRMTKNCAEQLATWLGKSTKYSADVVELFGGDSDSRLPNSLADLGEAIGLEQIQQFVRDCVSQGILSREEILEACNHAVNDETRITQAV